MIHYSKDTDHIVTLTLDMKGRQRNLLNHELVEAFRPVVEHLQHEKKSGVLRGVIIASAKQNFLVGGDLKYLSEVESPQDIFRYSEKLKAFFRMLEQPGVPVVAAINGNAIGMEQNGDPAGCFSADRAAFGRFYLVRLGKKKYHLFELA